MNKEIESTGYSNLRSKVFSTCEGGGESTTAVARGGEAARRRLWRTEAWRNDTWSAVVSVAPVLMSWEN